MNAEHIIVPVCAVIMAAACPLWYPVKSQPDKFYHLQAGSISKPFDPCLEPGVEHRCQILAKEMFEGRLPLDVTAVILDSPIDRLRRDELVMLCRIVSEDCKETRK